MKANRCNPCNYVGVRVSYVDRNAFTHFLEKTVLREPEPEPVYITLESKMNEQEPFADFKARTYGRNNDPTYENKNICSAG